MNKKAQFYIITAVILLAMTYGFFRPKLTYEKEGAFREICDNYFKESSFAANTGNLEDFTQKFAEYANSKESGFGIVYLYAQNSNITAFSLVKKTIYINELKLEFNQTLVINKENSVTITIESNQHVINTSEYPKVGVLCYSESGNTKKVIVE
jgi:hypothetical protein